VKKAWPQFPTATMHLHDKGHIHCALPIQGLPPEAQLCSMTLHKITSSATTNIRVVYKAASKG